MGLLNRNVLESSLRWAIESYQGIPFYKKLGRKARELRKRIKYFKNKLKAL